MTDMSEDKKALIMLICDKILDDETTLTVHQVREMLQDALDEDK